MSTIKPETEVPLPPRPREYYEAALDEWPDDEGLSYFCFVYGEVRRALCDINGWDFYDFPDGTGPEEREADAVMCALVAAGIIGPQDVDRLPPTEEGAA